MKQKIKRKKKQAAKQMNIRNNNKKEALPKAPTPTHTHSRTHTHTPTEAYVCVLPRDKANQSEICRTNWSINSDQNFGARTIRKCFPIFLFLCFSISDFPGFLFHDLANFVNKNMYIVLCNILLCAEVCHLNY